VNPDSAAQVEARRAAGQPVFVNQGTGLARGMDLLLMGRTRHLFYGASVGLLASDRTNPLAANRKTYPTPWDQKFTSALSLSWSPNDRWLVSGRFSFRTGRPYTSIESFTLQSDYYVPNFSGVNGDRYPFFYELSGRVEYRFGLGPVKMAAYGEVMNITHSQNVFIYIYDTGNPATQSVPQRDAVNHLPIRPFLGVRAEY
jgi:hypothetical protein